MAQEVTNTDSKKWSFFAEIETWFLAANGPTNVSEVILFETARTRN